MKIDSSKDGESSPVCDAIDIWLVSYDKIDASALGGWSALLSADERSQQQRFHFPEDRKRYLVTRALVRRVLSHYVSVAPEEWVFATDRHGRPRIDSRHTAAEGLMFNVSHTRGLIALGVARGRELGIDVENVVASHGSLLEVAERFFAPLEVAELACIPRALQHRRFFEYWTLKESYIKARGLGLSLPLERFSFHRLQEGAIQFNVDPCLGDQPESWNFWQYGPSNEYMLSVCASHLPGREVRPSLYRLTSLGTRIPLALAPLRQSIREGG